METENGTSDKMKIKLFMDGMIRFGVVAGLTFLCFRLIAPFLSLLLWAMIFATVLYPLNNWLAARMGGKRGRSAAVLILLALLLIGIPVALLGQSFANQLLNLHTSYEENALAITPPPDSVKEWPLVGERVYRTWSAAAENLPALLEANKVQLHNISMKGLAVIRSTLSSVMLFIGALIVAGIMMAFGEGGSLSLGRILSRLAGPEKGPVLHRLSTATVRSVATGVIGVAFIQALLLGLGFLLAGVPAAGVLAMVVMLLGILQLPAMIVSLPAIAYIWVVGDASLGMNILYTVLLLAAGMVDNVLKPILLGRGVDAPMPIVLIGAMGGMITSGIVGLFVGAVLLSVGYEIFMAWVNDGVAEDEQHELPEKPAAAV